MHLLVAGWGGEKGPRPWGSRGGAQICAHVGGNGPATSETVAAARSPVAGPGATLGGRCIVRAGLCGRADSACAWSRSTAHPALILSICEND